MKKLSLPKKYPHITLYIPQEMTHIFIRMGRRQGVPIYGKLLCLIAEDLFRKEMIPQSLVDAVYQYPYRKGRPTSSEHLSSHFSFAIPKPFRKTLLRVMDRYLARAGKSRSSYIWGLVWREELKPSPEQKAA